MTSTGMNNSTIGALGVPGARLHYELRGDGPLLLLVGAPMDADAFTPVSEVLAGDYTVLTTDPRGINRSSVENVEVDSTPELRADDLSRLIAHAHAGPAAVFGSSGGAVTALALAQAHPEQVHTVIAHEPPLIDLLEDREQLRAATEDCRATYLAGDVVGGWAKFFALANIDLPSGAVSHMFGGQRDPRVVADEHFWFAREMRPSSYWRPNLTALRSAAPRIVVGIGEDSTGQVCDRTSRALAVALGTEIILFPGDHTGFVEAPEAFADRLHAVLRQPR